MQADRDRALHQTIPHATELRAGLAEVVAAWPTLPEAVKAGIVAMVKAAGLGPNRGAVSLARTSTFLNVW